MTHIELPSEGTVSLRVLSDAIAGVAGALEVPDNVVLRVVAFRAGDGTYHTFAASLEIGADEPDLRDRCVSANGLFLVTRVTDTGSIAHAERLRAFLSSWRANIGGAGGGSTTLQDSVQVRREYREPRHPRLPRWHFTLYDEPLSGATPALPRGPFADAGGDFFATTVGHAAAEWLGDDSLRQYTTPRQGIEAVLWDGRATFDVTEEATDRLAIHVVRRANIALRCNVVFRLDDERLARQMQPVEDKDILIAIPPRSTWYEVFLVGTDGFCYDVARGGVQRPVASTLADTRDRILPASLGTPTGANSMAASPAAGTRATSYVDDIRLTALRALVSPRFDFTRLIRLLEELNASHGSGCLMAVVSLTRAILDHVPPIFGVATFTQVANGHAGGRSFKASMQHLDQSARKIADYYLHQQIRSREMLPTATQVDFSRDLDVLLGEIVRIS